MVKMEVVEKKVIMGREEAHGDKFPIGMRVLAVDDDPICLKVLETLLLRCQYHVTTTNQAIKALDMLRENKDKFDLVISDVHMPDMDGFKLLELVGLEMDLPVIMLSANGETKAVMKGITHGACDYLLKPVRIEELRNIWQHVVRRRSDRKEHPNSDNGENLEKPQASTTSDANGPLDHNSKVNKKRKEQNNEDEDDNEEGTHESEDPSNQKKPRVVWSVELHRKFVSAVNQLGIDKAVPKRILDLMNVEKLTRENVASHLQKYRLYLKRLSAVASQQANLAAALGGRDASSYLRMGSYNGFGNFHGFASFQSSGVPNRANRNLLGLPGIAPSMVQIGCTQNSTNNPIDDPSKFPHSPMFQGIPASLELDHHQHKQKTINEPNNPFQGAISVAPNGTFVDYRGLVNRPSVAAPSAQENSFEMGSIVSPHLPDLSKCSDVWQNPPSLNAYSANRLSIGMSFSDDNITPSNMLQSPNASFGGNMLLVSSGIDSESKLLSFKGVENVEQNLDDPEQQNALETCVSFSPSFSSTLTNQTPSEVSENQNFKNQNRSKKIDATIMNQPSYDTAAASIAQYTKTDKSIFDSRITFNEDNMFGASKSCNFDELLNAMIKLERDDLGFINEEIGSDLYSLRTCL